MANKFYAAGEQRADKVRDLFAAIAPRYDLINDLQSFGLHRYWKERLLRLACLKQGERALDVCCGTGDLALAMAQRGAIVSGLDFSKSMLNVARQRRANAGIISNGENVVFFIRGDALRLPFSDSQFDVVTVGYGLRNLADFRAGLAEICRVARPQGRLLVLDFGKPDNALWRGLYLAYLRCVVPWFGRLFCGDAESYAYIWESLKQYPAQRGVAKALEELNCKQVRIINLMGGMMSINYAVTSHQA